MEVESNSCDFVSVFERPAIGSRARDVSRVLQKKNMLLTHLQPLDLDEFLEPIDDDELTLLVVPRDVPRVQPTIHDRRLRRLLVPVVTLHHLGERKNRFRKQT